MGQLYPEIMQLTPDAGTDTLLVIRRRLLRHHAVPRGARRPSINFQVHGLQLGFSRLFEDYHGPNVFVVYGDQWRATWGCMRTASCTGPIPIWRFSAGRGDAC